MRVRLLLLLGVCSDGSTHDVDVVARLRGGDDDARAYYTIHAHGLRTSAAVPAQRVHRNAMAATTTPSPLRRCIETTIADEDNASGWSWASFAAGAAVSS